MRCGRIGRHSTTIALTIALILGVAGQPARGQVQENPYVAPPPVVAEAGVLPTHPLGRFLDRFDEWFQRNVFSFWIPVLRARIALEQASERIAELHALERNGQLTPAATRSLILAHADLLEIPNGIVARQIVAGNAQRELARLLVRARLSAAEALAELADELEVEIELEGSPSEPAPDGERDAGPAPHRSGAPGAGPAADLELLPAFLAGVASGLEAIEDVLPEEADGAPLPPDLLQIFAVQAVAQAERGLLRAQFTVEERRAHGKVVIADAELRAAAEASLLMSRQFLAGGHYREALLQVNNVREIARRLRSEAIVVEPRLLFTAPGAQVAKEVIEDLVEEGFFGAVEQRAALGRVREVIEELRGNHPRLPAPPGPAGAATDSAF